MDKYQEKIIEYIRGELSEKDTTAVEKLLKASCTFRQEYEKLKVVWDLFGKLPKLEVKEILSKNVLTNIKNATISLPTAPEPYNPGKPKASLPTAPEPYNPTKAEKGRRISLLRYVAPIATVAASILFMFVILPMINTPIFEGFEKASPMKLADIEKHSERDIPRKAGYYFNGISKDAADKKLLLPTNQTPSTIKQLDAKHTNNWLVDSIEGKLELTKLRNDLNLAIENQQEVSETIEQIKSVVINSDNQKETYNKLKKTLYNIGFTEELDPSVKVKQSREFRREAEEEGDFEDEIKPFGSEYYKENNKARKATSKSAGSNRPRRGFGDFSGHGGGWNPEPAPPNTDKPAEDPGDKSVGEDEDSEVRDGLSKLQEIHKKLNKMHLSLTLKHSVLADVLKNETSKLGLFSGDVSQLKKSFSKLDEKLKAKITAGKSADSENQPVIVILDCSIEMKEALTEEQKKNLPPESKDKFKTRFDLAKFEVVSALKSLKANVFFSVMLLTDSGTAVFDESGAIIDYISESEHLLKVENKLIEKIIKKISSLKPGEEPKKKKQIDDSIMLLVKFANGNENVIVVTAVTLVQDIGKNYERINKSIGQVWIIDISAKKATETWSKDNKINYIKR